MATLIPKVIATDRRGPIPHSGGCVGFGLGGQFAPCSGGSVDNGVVVFEDGVREPGLTQILPDVLDRVQLGRL